jgi:hypothetical protein
VRALLGGCGRVGQSLRTTRTLPTASLPPCAASTTAQHNGCGNRKHPPPLRPEPQSQLSCSSSPACLPWTLPRITHPASATPLLSHCPMPCAAAHAADAATPPRLLLQTHYGSIPRLQATCFPGVYSVHDVYPPPRAPLLYCLALPGAAAPSAASAPATHGKESTANPDREFILSQLLLPCPVLLPPSNMHPPPPTPPHTPTHLSSCAAVSFSSALCCCCSSCSLSCACCCHDLWYLSLQMQHIQQQQLYEGWGGDGFETVCPVAKATTCRNTYDCIHMLCQARV